MAGVMFNPFGESATFHHVGLVVRSIADVSPSAETWTDTAQLVKVAFVVLQGLRVELVEPISDKSPVSRALEKNQKLLHLCYEVEDIALAIDASRKKGFYCFAKPVPAIAFDNRRIAWLSHKEYGVFELLQK